MTTRPLSDADGGTCDWGNCDDDAVAARLAPDGQWLSVCQTHTGPKRHTSPGRARCTHCGDNYALNISGQLRMHNRRFDRCPGSGTTPTKETQ